MGTETTETKVKVMAKRSASKRSEFTGTHSKHKDGKHLVRFENLSVVLVPDGDNWYAQGIEIDYAAQGKDPSDAREQFEQGLARTVHLHLQVYGDLQRLLKVAPADLQNELLYVKGAMNERLSCVYQHELGHDPQLRNLPFERIKYYLKEAA
jgi:hypothetical protein